MNSKAKQLVLSVFVAYLCVACSGGDNAITTPTPPAQSRATGAVRVTVRSTGSDIDLDGYELAVGAERRSNISSEFTELFDNLIPGVQFVTLFGMAKNCTLSGETTRTVDVSAGKISNVLLEIRCVQTGIAITTRTTGLDINPEYRLFLDGRLIASINANDSLRVGRLEDGLHSVELFVDAPHCAIENGNAIQLTVEPQIAKLARFVINCAKIVRPQKIAYAVDTAINSTIVTWIETVNVDGSGATPVAQGHSPSWSPAGTWLLAPTARCGFFDFYYGSACPGPTALIDPDSKAFTQLQFSEGVVAAAWSPTGDAIAYVQCCQWSKFLRIKSTDGSVVYPQLPVFEIRDIAWSPDGKRLAFQGTFNAGYRDLGVMDRDGKNFVRLTYEGVAGPGISWRPDSKSIAFSRDFGNVGIVSLETLKISTLARGTQPSWSPDGSQLVFSGDDGLYTINADGSNLKRITRGQHYAPAWRP